MKQLFKLTSSLLSTIFSTSLLSLSAIFLITSSALANNSKDTQVKLANYFSIALRNDNGETVKSLIHQGLDVNQAIIHDDYPLIAAIKLPSPKITNVLLDDKQIDVNVQNQSGETPLMLAVLKNENKVAIQLLAKGAKVNKSGWTALHYAASSNNLAMVKILLAHGAKINAKSPNGTTVLMMASGYGGLESVKYLVKSGVQLNSVNEKGYSALSFAQRAGKDEVVAFLKGQQSSLSPALKPNNKPLIPTHSPIKGW